MRANDFLSIYQADSVVQTLSDVIRVSKPNTLHVKGLHGSLDAVVFASTFRSGKFSHVVILQDKEEAAYFQNDLQNLLGDREVLLFPMSYKRPYEYDETENANILMRAEVLNQITTKPDFQIIITYPEALSEKVITKKSLATNTYVVSIGEKLDREFLEEFLHSYDFEKTDFVQEAGQFAMRGGILDIFSFANELPYRIELFGDEVDSIRSFDPGSQLSVDKLDKISVMPNVQTRLVQEDRQSFFEFIPSNTKIWLKDVQLTLDVVEKSFAFATENFDKVVKQSGQAKLALHPESLFESGDSLLKLLKQFMLLEFGQRFLFQPSSVHEFKSFAQPSFNKNFELLASNLFEYQLNGFTNFICSEQPRQLERLQGIFEEIHPELKFQSLEFALQRFC